VRVTVTVRLAVARSIDRADCCSDRSVADRDRADGCSERNAAAAASDGEDTPVAEPAAIGRNADRGRSSTKTELPQFVQNDRSGSTRRPHDAQTISWDPTRFRQQRAPGDAWWTPMRRPAHLYVRGCFAKNAQNLALEALLQLWITLEVFGQDLDSNGAVQARIATRYTSPMPPAPSGA
jgi:hypothetical protein